MWRSCSGEGDFDLRFVGWVERSETHRFGHHGWRSDGLRFANPSYAICLASPSVKPNLRHNNPTGKIPLPSSGKSIVKHRPSRPIRGACARHDTRGGMRWTRRRRTTNADVADGEGVWSRSHDAGIKLRERCARRRWQGSPAHRGEHAISRKPLRRGCRLFRLPCLACVRKVHTFLHARLAGAASIRHSLRPLLQRARQDAKLGHFRAARMRTCARIAV
jgi:hypothetical protein